MFNQQQPPQTTEVVRERQRMAVEIRRQHREEVIAKKRVIPQQRNIEVESTGNNQLDQQLRGFYRKTVTTKDLLGLIQKLHSNELMEVYEGMIGIRQLLAKQQAVAIQDIIELNILPKIMHLAIQADQPKLRVEATWALANVASGTHEQCQVLVNRGGIPLFLHLLESQDEHLLDQVVWGVSNVASDNTGNRDSFLVGGALQLIIRIIDRTTNKAIKVSASWALSNLCRGIPAPKQDLIKDATPYITQVVADPLCEPQTLLDCCWALYHLSQNNSNLKQIVSTPGLCNRLAELACCNNDLVTMPVIRTMGSLLSAADQDVPYQLVQADILTPFQKLLSHFKKVIRREVSWCLSNFAACNFDKVLTIIERDSLIRKMLEMLAQNEAQTQLQLLWVFRNLASTVVPAMYKFMCSYRVVRHIVNVLSSTMEPKLQQAALSGLKYLLRLGDHFKQTGPNVMLAQLKQLGAITLIDNLQLSQSNEVYQLALQLLEQYCELVNPLAR